VNFARVYTERDSTKYLTFADAGVQIIYLEHETSD
jgi:hypothetical protein